MEKVTSALTLPKDASNREQAFQEVKDKGEAWVAKYRKGGGFQGRPSFRCGGLLELCTLLYLGGSLVFSNFNQGGSLGSTPAGGHGLGLPLHSAQVSFGWLTAARERG